MTEILYKKHEEKTLTDIFESLFGRQSPPQPLHFLFKKMSAMHKGLNRRLMELIETARSGNSESFIQKKPSHEEIYGTHDLKNPGLLEWAFEHKQQKILDFLYTLLHYPWENADLSHIVRLNGISGSAHEILIAIVCRKRNVDTRTLEKALGLSVRCGKIILIKACLEQGININTPLNISGEYSGSTPLHLAVKYGSLSLVKFLIEAGADKQVQDREGRSLLFIAMHFNHSELKDYLYQTLTHFTPIPAG